jgi:hypothetical protein
MSFFVLGVAATKGRAERNDVPLESGEFELNYPRLEGEGFENPGRLNST